jgi:hypothetical protein
MCRVRPATYRSPFPTACSKTIDMVCVKSKQRANVNLYVVRHIKYLVFLTFCCSGATRPHVSSTVNTSHLIRFVFFLPLSMTRHDYKDTEIYTHLMWFDGMCCECHRLNAVSAKVIETRQIHPFDSVIGGISKNAKIFGDRKKCIIHCKIRPQSLHMRRNNKLYLTTFGFILLK